jgi:hypothetical protein
MSESQSRHPLLDPTKRVELEKRLNACEHVRRFDDPGNRESAAIADALGDLETVFRRYLDQLLPKALAATSCDELEDALFDIRMDFEEVVWHLWYPKSFRVQLLGEDSQPPAIDKKLRP